MHGTTIELLWSHGIVCPLVRRTWRCAWGFYVAWQAGLHQKAPFPPLNAGTAEPFRVSPPEAVAYPLELHLVLVKHLLERLTLSRPRQR
jgi:hypothetical protein